MATTTYTPANSEYRSAFVTNQFSELDLENGYCSAAHVGIGMGTTERAYSTFLRTLKNKLYFTTHTQYRVLMVQVARA